MSPENELSTILTALDATRSSGVSPHVSCCAKFSRIVENCDETVGPVSAFESNLFSPFLFRHSRNGLLFLNGITDGAVASRYCAVNDDG